jgi:predicted Zn-dependent protease
MKLVTRSVHQAADIVGRLLGRVAAMLAILLLGRLRQLGYSRDVESAADITGSDVCAASRYNPWGLVWLFRDFDSADTAQVPQVLSDHPNNANRVAALEQHFRSNPAVFSSFSADPRNATAFEVPKNAPMTFMR